MSTSWKLWASPLGDWLELEGLIPGKGRSRDLAEEMKDIYDSFSRCGVITYNVKEVDGDYTIKITSPGFSRSKYKINCVPEKETLEVFVEGKEKDVYSFRREFKIPKLDPQGITAKYEDGIMTIVVKKLVPKNPAFLVPIL